MSATGERFDLSSLIAVRAIGKQMGQDYSNLARSSNYFFGFSIRGNNHDCTVPLIRMVQSPPTI